ncbi:MAG: AAA family ATPase [Clostridia bacterium]|nr:AAA family ATPase [Clostridia bacterium]
MTLELGLIIGLSVLLAIVCICQYKKNHEMVKALSEKEDALKRLIQELNSQQVELASNNHKQVAESINEIERTFSEIKRENIEIEDKIDLLQNTQVTIKEDLYLAVNKLHLELLEKLAAQAKLIEILHEQNQDFERKLAIFTEIEEDSKGLNVTEEVKAQEALLSKALSEIKKRPLATESALNTERQVIDESESSVLVPADITPIDHQVQEELVLDEEQRRAYELMENTNENFFITGKAGTGKSFLLKLFVEGTKKKVLKVAPTGISALNIDAATIHSVFGYRNLENISLEELDATTMYWSMSLRMLKYVDTIIIDEISMVRADIFDKMEKILRIVNKSEKLFGNKQIIVFGDMFQLPPIATKEEELYLMDKYGGVFFFNSMSYDFGNFNFIELTVNHRQQKDETFFNVLNRIREGEVRKEDLALLNTRVIKNREKLRRIIRLYPKRADADRVNREELAKIPAKEYVYNHTVTLNKYNDQNIVLENYFQAVSTLRLKVGALVVMTRNDRRKRWVNGTLAIISSLEKDRIEIAIDGRNYFVLPERFEIKEAVYRNGGIHYDVSFSANQYPIMLAYAITIHKSQGMTYQKIACDPSDCFATGQAYVALSRCVSLEGIHLLSDINETEIKVDPHVKEFYLHAKKETGKIEKKIEYGADIETNICGHKVCYIEKTHQYFVDDIEVPSITKIVDTIASKYGWDNYAKVNKEVLELAKANGERLHREIEEYETNGIIGNSTEIVNYLRIKDEQGFTVIKNEQIVVLFDHVMLDHLQYYPIAAGRLDMIVSEGDKVGVLEVKRTSKLYLPKVEFQLNLYRMAYRQCNNETNVDFLRVIRLRENSTQVKEINIDEAKTWEYLYEYMEMEKK